MEEYGLDSHVFIIAVAFKWAHAVSQQKVDELNDAMSATQRDLAKKFFKSLEEGAVSSYWQIWTSHHKRVQIRKKHLLSSTLKKITHAFESRGFLQLKHAVTQMKVDELAAQFSGHKGDVARRFFQRLQNGAVASYFAIWSKSYQRKKARKQAVLSSSLKKLSHSFGTRAVLQWRHTVERMKVKQLRMLLAGSHDENADHRIQVATLIMRRIMEGSKASFYRVWSAHFQRQKERKRVLLNGSLRKLEHSFEARGFLQWRKSVECMKTDELASQLSGHKGDVAREFFKRLQQGAIANYFSIWTAHHVRVQARKRALLSGSLKKITHAFEARGFMQVFSSCSWHGTRRAHVGVTVHIET